MKTSLRRFATVAVALLAVAIVGVGVQALAGGPPSTAKTRSNTQQFNALLTLGAGVKNDAPQATFPVTSTTSAATASTSVSAVTIQPTNPLDATDLVFSVQGVDGGIYFAVDQSGSLYGNGGSAPAAGNCAAVDAGTGLSTCTATVRSGSNCVCSSATAAVTPQIVSCIQSAGTLTAKALTNVSVAYVCF